MAARDLGFEEVHDYVDGKADWLAAGLPTEGTNAERPHARDVARSDVPTCRLDEAIGEVVSRVRAAGWDTCVVVNEERVVFGLMRDRELTRGAEQEGPVERFMRPGPSTFRPDVPIEEMATFMTEHDLVNGEGTRRRRSDSIRGVFAERHRGIRSGSRRLRARSPSG